MALGDSNSAESLLKIESHEVTKFVISQQSFGGFFSHKKTSNCWPRRYGKFRVNHTSAVQRLFKKNGRVRFPPPRRWRINIQLFFAVNF